MKVRSCLLSGLLACVSTYTMNTWAQGNDRVEFPDNYRDGVHYATVERGNIREEIYTSTEAIEAAKSGQPLPSGTIITMEDYRGDQLFRYIVMEKREGWGERYPQDIRNGDWEFQSFQPDRTVNRSENVTRCMGCHKPQEKNDYVFTLDRMRSATLSQVESALRQTALMTEVPHGQFDASTIALLAREHELTAGNSNTN